jgi:hypothetical protein
LGNEHHGFCVGTVGVTLTRNSLNIARFVGELHPLADKILLGINVRRDKGIFGATYQ